MEPTKRGRRKSLKGKVVSDRANKTIIVEVTRRVQHRLYGKVLKRRVKFSAHDDENTAGIGDTVLIVETRPLSKTKRWRLTEIVDKAR